MHMVYIIYVNYKNFVIRAIYWVLHKDIDMAEAIPSPSAEKG